MKGCPTWFVVSDGMVVEGYIDLVSAAAYMDGTPCDIIGTTILMADRKEVRIDDCIIKMVLGPDYEVCPN